MKNIPVYRFSGMYDTTSLSSIEIVSTGANMNTGSRIDVYELA